ncbi:Peptidase S46 [Lishizhenia tianjinensis]|uniref:Dipeptidyl-peptidase n=1 Tax=Lishizhenia tianjinensis TaxID=477690 RepID=A0A1I6YM34_9FLAO|nr:S46 family peptidase [Lishizhenia tianjinensis]SFT51536.1 Peptidase S46 [Lishizhenia tianjinensis]
MKKLLLILCVGIGFFGRSEEGMIIPTLLSAFESDMQAMGMKLSAEDIYDANNASIKDAVMHFGGGCTAEIVSDQGLMLTNHHCGFSQINAHSTLENNYLKYGFWAKSKEDELANPGLTATRMVRIEDVTRATLAGTEDLSGNDLALKIRTNIALLVSEATKGTHYTAEIKPFDYGNSYYLLVKEEFLDVRLVGAPPSTVGKFGGDTDNWVWPRHTGDFSVFRIYAGENNEPAEYSTNNKPYQPLHYLPVSIKDRAENDFTMVFGFPGRTYQHTISSELAFIIDTQRPAQIRMRDHSLSVIKPAMKASEATTLQYASKQSRIANAWKKWIGQIDGLKRNDAVAKKLAYEKRYTEQANLNRNWKEKYGTVVQDLNALATKYNNANFAYEMFIEYMYYGPEAIRTARNLYGKLIDTAIFQNAEKLAQLKADLIAGAEGHFKNFDANIDKEIFKLQTAEYIKHLDESMMPEILKGMDVNSFAEEAYEKSITANKEKYIKFIEKLSLKSAKKFMKDPMFQLYHDVDNTFRSKVLNDVRIYSTKKNELMKTYVAGKYEMFPDDKHWADANSTLRVTYGKLEGSYPTDGIKYTPHTTLKGLIEKHNTGNPDFEVLPRMIELYEAKDYGQYAQDGELWVCFTGSNHTTGGNSGSPVLDAEGNLVGLNFDRSWESTMSDYMFDASRCRNITVDVRYVLWIMDTYANAGHLVDEMTLIK